MKNLLIETLSQIDELRQNLELLKENSIISEFTYDNEYEKLCELESTLERKKRQGTNKIKNL
jgi:uncharacterized protein YkvS|tara:strand:- start:145 stop:330 length:186 start_codon:yes stop_codon:yes gene_type:complete